MKLVVLSKSPEDEAAVRILVDGILGISTEHIAPPFRARGWTQLVGVLAPVLRQLHFHTNTDALAVIVDSDASPTHRQAHVTPDGANQGCRLCQLRLVADQVQSGLTKVPNRAPVKTAFGLAVPALERGCYVDSTLVQLKQRYFRDRTQGREPSGFSSSRMSTALIDRRRE